MKNALSTNLLKSVYINVFCSMPVVVVYPTSITTIFRSEYTSKSKKRRRVTFNVSHYNFSEVVDAHGIPFILVLQLALSNAGFKNVKIKISDKYLRILVDDYKFGI